ncbi:hypothetical protein Cfor_06777 [Coptotermes formosanus]|jgi:hypothetical protein|uniref:Odorant receptor n=1 Tax=Coptotermes formosanus TaxID=36987 RepID=A0A6L2PFD2_COPFO|nr:hypothetical protein Cfor_06777 [Coptotermes formosanus]
MAIFPSKMIKFMDVEEHRGAKELFEFNLNTLRILGVWKWDVPQWRLYRAFAFLTIISLILFVVTQVCYAYIHITNLDRLTKVLIPGVFSGLLAFKYTYLLIRSDEAFELIYQLQNEIFTKERPPTRQQSVILNRYAARAKFYSIVRSNIALSIIIFWLLYPIKDMLGEYAEDASEYVKFNRSKATIVQLPFVAYYPYDVENNTLYYILTYLYQAFCGLSVFVGMPAWDMLFVSIFIHISGHFKALQHVLIHLSDEAREILQLDKTELQLHRAIQLSEQTDADVKSVWRTGDGEGNLIIILLAFGKVCSMVMCTRNLLFCDYW